MPHLSKVLPLSALLPGALPLSSRPLPIALLLLNALLPVVVLPPSAPLPSRLLPSSAPAAAAAFAAAVVAGAAAPPGADCCMRAAECELSLQCIAGQFAWPSALMLCGLLLPS